MSDWLVREADAVERMALMPEASIDAIVCDPPYSLSFMGKDWDKDLNHGPWATEALRVLKPGGHLLAFGGTRTYHRLACAIEDAGFEIRDSLIWLYGSGFPKSLNLDGEWEGWGTALKPGHEPIVVARKPLTGTVAQNVLEHGTGALNIDGCRVEGDSGNGHWVRNGEMGTNGIYGDGGEAGEDFGRENPASGRWPANVLLSPEAAEELDEQSGERGNNARRDKAGGCEFFMGGDSRESAPWSNGDTGGASRFFFTAQRHTMEECAGVSSAGLSLSQSRRVGGSAQSDVATGEHPEDSSLDSPNPSGRPSTSGTQSESGRSGESDMPPTLSTGSESLPESKQPKPSPTSNPASPVEQSEPIDTTTTIPNPSKSDGSVEAVISEDTQPSLAPGALDSQPRFRYTAKASRGERNAGLDGFEERATGVMQDDAYKWERDGKGNEINLNTRAKNSHPTVKPIDLMRWLVRLVTPPGGTVLDPFAGSGTTGIAAVLEGFDFIGIEREAEYCEIARARIAWWEPHAGRDTDEVLIEAGFSERLQAEYREAGQLELGASPIAEAES